MEKALGFYSPPISLASGRRGQLVDPDSMSSDSVDPVGSTPMGPHLSSPSPACLPAASLREPPQGCAPHCTPSTCRPSSLVLPPCGQAAHLGSRDIGKPGHRRAVSAEHAVRPHLSTYWHLSLVLSAHSAIQPFEEHLLSAYCVPRGTNVEHNT